jgi:hypothetical protein
LGHQEGPDRERAGVYTPAPALRCSKVWRLVSLRLFKLVLNVVLDASRCSFTFLVNFFGATHWAILMLCGFVGLASGVVLRFFGLLSSIVFGHAYSFPRWVCYEGSSSRRFFYHSTLAALRAILFRLLALRELIILELLA